MGAEAKEIRIFDAVALAQPPPVDGDDGIPVDPVWPGTVELRLRSAAASGTRTIRAIAWGWQANVLDTSGVPISGSGAWHPLFDTGTENSATDKNYAYPLGLLPYSRLAISIPDVPGGTTPAATASFALGSPDAV